MSFTADVSTDLGKVRCLIGDTDGNNPIFQDDAITVFLGLVNSSLYLASALALDAQAAQMASNLNNVKMGYFSQDDTSKYDALKEQAQRFRDLEYNTPAFAVTEENLSGFNELMIIRNFILRTEL